MVGAAVWRRTNSPEGVAGRSAALATARRDCDREKSNTDATGRTVPGTGTRSLAWTEGRQTRETFEGRGEETELRRSSISLFLILPLLYIPIACSRRGATREAS